MRKADKEMLEHLKVCDTGLSDTYFCSIYYKNKVYEAGLADKFAASPKGEFVPVE